MPSDNSGGTVSSFEIPLSVPSLLGNEERYLQECIQTNYVSSVGPFVNRFEELLAQRLGNRFTVATNSGTSAIHLMLIAAGVKPGDLVIIPSYSFVATANAVSMAGATPWFMDIEPNSWGMDPKVVRQELVNKCENSEGGLTHKETGKKVSLIMPVYCAGHPPRVQELSDVARDFDIPLVFDGAAAIGSKVNGLNIGQLGFPHALSFNGNKIITCGGGGAVILDEEMSARMIRHLSTTARTEDGYSHDAVAFNYRLTNVQAAIGVAQLERLEFLLEAKRRIFNRYKIELEDLSGGTFPDLAPDLSSYQVSGVVLKESQRGQIREIVTNLGNHGIQSREFWKPIHRMKPYQHCPASLMTTTDALSNRVLLLPNSSSLTREEQERVIRIVRSEIARN